MRRVRPEFASVSPIPMLGCRNNPEHKLKLTMVRYIMAKLRLPTRYSFDRNTKQHLSGRYFAFTIDGIRHYRAANTMYSIPLSGTSS
jgi:hypothetical protein